MTYAAIAIAAVTAVVGITANVRAGQAQKAQAQFEAKQMEANAEQAHAEASSQEDVQRMHARAVVGSQLAAQAQAGVQLNGSAADLLKQSLFNADADAQQIRYEGESKARGLTNQAGGTLFSGRLAQQASNWSAVGSLMSAAGSAYGSYAKGK